MGKKLELKIRRRQLGGNFHELGINTGGSEHVHSGNAQFAEKEVETVVDGRGSQNNDNSKEGRFQICCEANSSRSPEKEMNERDKVSWIRPDHNKQKEEMREERNRNQMSCVDYDLARKVAKEYHA